jgi:hypothetical protein
MGPPTAHRIIVGSFVFDIKSTMHGNNNRNSSNNQGPLSNNNNNEESQQRYRTIVDGREFRGPLSTTTATN